MVGSPGQRLGQNKHEFKNPGPFSMSWIISASFVGMTPGYFVGAPPEQQAPVTASKTMPLQEFSKCNASVSAGVTGIG